MIAKEKLLKAIELSKQLSITTGLTDEQVDWIKNKIETVEAWKDTAVTEIVSIKARLTTLETKAAQAQTKFNQTDARLAAIESRLTAHGI